MQVRNALNLLIDRNYIVDEIIGGGQVPASSFVAMGITEPDGSQFYQHAGNSADYIGYYPVDAASYEARREQAMEILSQYYTIEGGKVTDFPILTYLYNDNTAFQRIAEVIQQDFASVGVQLDLQPVSWNDYYQELAKGEYSIARGGWIADYNDALNFLDLFRSNSGNNNPHLGQGSHELAEYTVDLSDLGLPSLQGSWKETYDKLIKMILEEANLDVRNILLHKAEDLLMETGCVCPIYYYTDVYMLSQDVTGFFTTPTGGRFFMYTSILQ